MTTSQIKAIQVTDCTFDQEVIQAEKPVLVDFGADWCPPCKAIGPIVDSLTAEYEGKAVIAKLDVDTNPYITSRYGDLPRLLLDRT